MQAAPTASPCAGALRPATCASPHDPSRALLRSDRPLPSRSQVLAGEERLSVRWDRDSDTVLFRVRSYSRPRHAFGLLGYPVVRLQQRRFARDAAQAMRRACTEG